MGRLAVNLPPDGLTKAAAQLGLGVDYTAPGMTSHSLVPKAAAKVGIGFEELCWRILETSFPESAA